MINKEREIVAEKVIENFRESAEGIPFRAPRRSSEPVIIISKNSDNSNNSNNSYFFISCPGIHHSGFGVKFLNFNQYILIHGLGFWNLEFGIWGSLQP